MGVAEQAAAFVASLEKTARKGKANGYCPLGADSKVPAENLPVAGDAGWVVGEYKAVDPSVTMPAGWYAADGETHNGFATLNLNGGKFVKGGTAAGAGGASTHQHDAVSAGTPEGTVAQIEATQDVGLAQPNLTAPSQTYAANTHTHPAPTFSGSALGTHQHASASSEPPYLVLKWWCYCGE